VGSDIFSPWGIGWRWSQPVGSEGRYIHILFDPYAFPDVTMQYGRSVKLPAYWHFVHKVV
jgi:hypothetical protein